MGAGVLSTSLIEGAPFDTIRDAWSRVTLAAAPATATPWTPLPRSNDAAELQEAVEAAAARHDHARTVGFHGAGPAYVMLGAVAGMITAVGLPEARPDVISGAFSGCLMGVYVSGGVVYVCHVWTSRDPSADDCKARWRLMTTDRSRITSAFFFKPDAVFHSLTPDDLALNGDLGGGLEFWAVVPGDDLVHPFVVVTAGSAPGTRFVLKRVEVPDHASGRDVLGLHWRDDGDY